MSACTTVALGAPSRLGTNWTVEPDLETCRGGRVQAGRQGGGDLGWPGCWSWGAGCLRGIALQPSLVVLGAGPASGLSCRERVLGVQGGQLLAVGELGGGQGLVGDDVVAQDLRGTRRGKGEASVRSYCRPRTPLRGCVGPCHNCLQGLSPARPLQLYGTRLGRCLPAGCTQAAHEHALPASSLPSTYRAQGAQVVGAQRLLGGEAQGLEQGRKGVVGGRQDLWGGGGGMGVCVQTRMCVLWCVVCAQDAEEGGPTQTAGTGTGKDQYQ